MQGIHVAPMVLVLVQDVPEGTEQVALGIDVVNVGFSEAYREPQLLM